MKSLLLATLVGLLMVGCGEDAQKEAVQEDEAENNNVAPFGEKFTIPDLNLTMIWVKPGTFMMGSPGSEKLPSGTFKIPSVLTETQHQVTLTKGFYLGKYELTQAQWKKVMGNNPSKWKKVMGNNPSSFKGTDRPVERVSWDDAVAFCKKLTEMEKKAGRVPEGMAYQLPTEAQWEYACRAGTTTAYSWGNTIAPSNTNYIARFSTRDFRSPLRMRTTFVGQYAANPWGFHDMHGNVSEWTADWYDDYPSGAVTDPEGPASGSFRVLRGGSWRTGGTNLRSAKRSALLPRIRFDALGFRVGFLPSK